PSGTSESEQASRVASQTPYHTLPLPGALITWLAMTLSAWSTPLNFVIEALTVSISAEISTWLAFRLIFPAAVTVMPLASSFTELPLLSSTTISAGPSCRVILCPAGVSKISCSVPLTLVRRQQGRLVGRLGVFGFVMFLPCEDQLRRAEKSQPAQLCFTNGAFF